MIEFKLKLESPEEIFIVNIDAWNAICGDWWNIKVFVGTKCQVCSLQLGHIEIEKN